MGDDMEYGFDERGDALVDAVLNFRVNQEKDKTIREILAQLPPEALILE